MIKEALTEENKMLGRSPTLVLDSIKEPCEKVERNLREMAYERKEFTERVTERILRMAASFERSVETLRDEQNRFLNHFDLELAKYT